MSLAIRGNDYFCQKKYQQAKNRARRSKMDPKIDTFGQVDIRDLAIFLVEKVVFSTFSKLFWSCLGSVWALFLALKCPLLDVFKPHLILFAIHNYCSPLGSREALINIDKASPGFLVENC